VAVVVVLGGLLLLVVEVRVVAPIRGVVQVAEQRDRVVMAALDPKGLEPVVVVKIKPVGTALLVALVVRVEMVWHG
jgi:hypothetical protein